MATRARFLVALLLLIALWHTAHASKEALTEVPHVLDAGDRRATVPTQIAGKTTNLSDPVFCFPSHVVDSKAVIRSLQLNLCSQWPLGCLQRQVRTR